jgi:membrane associated rhomboid family serine protease
MPLIVAFLAAGALAGAVIAFALDLRRPLELLQGALGGLIVGLILALLMPK